MAASVVAEAMPTWPNGFISNRAKTILAIRTTIEYLTGVLVSPRAKKLGARDGRNSSPLARVYREGRGLLAR